MLSIFGNDATSAILLDPHTTSPGHEPAIVRRSSGSQSEAGNGDLFERARRIYYRGRQTEADGATGRLGLIAS